MNLLRKELVSQVSLAEEVPRHPEELLVILLPVPIIKIQRRESGCPSHILRSSSLIPAPTLCEAGPEGGSHF